MKIKSGLVSLLLLCPASLEFLEARVHGGRTAATADPARAITTFRRQDPEDSSVLRQQAVVVDIRLARDNATTTLRLPLFDGSALNLVRTNRKTSLYDSVVWVGRVEGQAASAVILAVGKVVLIGKVTTQPTTRQAADYYEIEYLGNGLHVLRKYDPCDACPGFQSDSPEDRSGDLGWAAVRRAGRGLESGLQPEAPAFRLRRARGTREPR